MAFKCQSSKLYPLISYGLTMGLAIGSAILLLPGGAYAQRRPVADNTLGRENSRIVPNVEINGVLSDLIVDGAQRGTTRFHSFEEFHVDRNRGVYFDAPGVENILSRVTGGNSSEIFGTLGVIGSNANLFLMNPNGIIFGPDARLDVNGSFVATTANAIELGERGTFSASEPEESSLLRVRPTAFLFNQIANQPLNSITVNGELTVPANQSLLLVGGNPSPSAAATGRILLNNGRLAALSGRVDVAAIAEPGRVGLGLQNGLLFLRFPGELERSPISLINRSEINVRGIPGGDISIYADTFDLLNTSFLQGGIDPNDGFVGERAGDIVVNASGRVSLNQASAIGNSVLGNPEEQGNPQEQRNSQGRAGNIRITANDLFLDGNTPEGLTRLASRLRPRASGRGGNIFVSVAGQVSLTNGAAITTTTAGEGNAGNIRITGDRIHFDGQTENLVSDPETGDTFRSGSSVFSAVRGEGRGNGGNVRLEARSVRFTNGGSANTSTLGEGTAGNVTVIADDIFLQGVGTISQFRFSGIYSRAEAGARGASDGGVIRIQTGSLSVLDGATVTAETFSQGNAGRLFVDASRFVRVQGVNADGSESQLNFNTSTAGDAGTLQINTPRLMVLDGANVSARTSGAGRGGILEVNASESIMVDGTGSRLAFDTTDSGNAQGIILQTRDLRVQNQGLVTVSNGEEGTGNPGNLTVFAGTLVLRNEGFLVTETGSGRGGNIELYVDDLTLLRDRSLISASASGFADGGNVTIETPNGFVIAVLSENSDIIASADAGNGGATRARATGVFGFRQFRGRRTSESDFTASSVLGIDGVVEIDTEEREFEELEATPVTAEIAQGCAVRDGQTQSEFIITGRRGLPSNANEIIGSDAVQVDLVTPYSGAEDQIETGQIEEGRALENASLVEAQGWTVGADGEIILTAIAPTVTPQNSWQNSVGC